MNIIERAIYHSHYTIVFNVKLFNVTFSFSYLITDSHMPPTSLHVYTMMTKSIGKYDIWWWSKIRIRSIG